MRSANIDKYSHVCSRKHDGPPSPIKPPGSQVHETTYCDGFVPTITPLFLIHTRTVRTILDLATYFQATPARANKHETVNIRGKFTPTESRRIPPGGGDMTVTVSVL